MDYYDINKGDDNDSDDNNIDDNNINYALKGKRRLYILNAIILLIIKFNWVLFKIIKYI